ncbi:MAG: hypothetical protein JW772_04930 [Candidatus Diapherotrites archaeon]|nr:hypothetical protein [Candidatus Diapherotrites archaeon]
MHSKRKHARRGTSLAARCRRAKTKQKSFGEKARKRSARFAEGVFHTVSFSSVNRAAQQHAKTMLRVKTKQAQREQIDRLIGDYFGASVTASIRNRIAHMSAIAPDRMRIMLKRHYPNFDSRPKPVQERMVQEALHDPAGIIGLNLLRSSIELPLDGAMQKLMVLEARLKQGTTTHFEQNRLEDIAKMNAEAENKAAEIRKAMEQHYFLLELLSQPQNARYAIAKIRAMV